MQIFQASSKNMRSIYFYFIAIIFLSASMNTATAGLVLDSYSVSYDDGTTIGFTFDSTVYEAGVHSLTGASFSPTFGPLGVMFDDIALASSVDIVGIPSLQMTVAGDTATVSQFGINASYVNLSGNLIDVTADFIGMFQTPLLGYFDCDADPLTHDCPLITIAPEFNVISSHSSVSNVPGPAAAWLFGTALAGLIGFGKRRKTA